jgi:Zn-dependent peptidase ImmA (M78 family)
MSTSKEWETIKESDRNIILDYQNEFPVKVGTLAKMLGADVKISTLNAGISGEIRLIDNIVVIKVNRHDVKERQRFTIAHEIAHFLLHRDKIGDGIIDDILYRSRLSDELEQQANRLAADIIMPWTLIKKSLEKINSDKVEEKIEIVSKLAEVSLTAMKIRFGKI